MKFLILILLFSSTLWAKNISPPFNLLKRVEQPGSIPFFKSSIAVGLGYNTDEGKEKKTAATTNSKTYESKNYYDLKGKMIVKNMGVDFYYLPKKDDQYTYNLNLSKIDKYNKENSLVAIGGGLAIFNELGVGLSLKREKTVIPHKAEGTTYGTQDNKEENKNNEYSLGAVYKFEKIFFLGLMGDLISGEGTYSAPGYAYDFHMGAGVSTDLSVVKLRGDLSYLYAPEKIVSTNDKRGLFYRNQRSGFSLQTEAMLESNIPALISFGVLSNLYFNLDYENITVLGLQDKGIKIKDTKMEIGLGVDILKVAHLHLSKLSSSNSINGFEYSSSGFRIDLGATF